MRRGRKIRQSIGAFLMVIMLVTGGLPSGMLTARASDDAAVDATLTLGEFNESTKHFDQAMGSGTATFHSMVIGFNLSKEDPSENIELPSVDGFTYQTGISSDYSKIISMSPAKTADEIAEYIRQVTINGGSKGQEISVTLTTEEIKYRTFYWGGNGHFYQYVPFEDSSWTTAHSGSDKYYWTTAYNAAKEMVYNGRQGYLATVTSKEEDLFIFKASSKVGWLGGTRLKHTGEGDWREWTIDTGDKSGTSWYWACGPEAGEVFYDVAKVDSSSYSAADARNADQGRYFNWERGGGNRLGYEPNSGGIETCLATLTLSGGQGHATGSDVTGYSWNDLTNPQASLGGNWDAKGFFVEYGDQINGDSSDSQSSTTSSTVSVGGAVEAPLPDWATAAGLDKEKVKWNARENKMQLQQNVDLTGPIAIPAGTELEIDLNGKDLTGAAGQPAIQATGENVKLTLQDGTGGGTVSGGNGTAENPGGSAIDFSGVTGTSSIELGNTLSVQGGNGYNATEGDTAGTNGGDAIKGGSSLTVTVGDSNGVTTLRGGRGGNGTGTGNGGNGGAGISGSNVSITVGGDSSDKKGTIVGGDGGDATGTGTGGNGGQGVSAASVTVNTGGSVAGGNGGNAPETPGSGGPAGTTVPEQGTDGQSGKQHVHTWTYGQNGNAIIAYCSASSEGCCYQGESQAVSISLSAGNVIYSGSAYSGAGVPTDQKQKWKAAGLNIPDIKYYSIAEDGTGTETPLGGAPVNAGNYKATITVGGEEDSKTSEAVFRIEPKDLTDAMVTLDHDEFVISGSPQGPAVTVTDGTTLTLDLDYTVTGHALQTERGTYTVIVDGKGNYEGTVTKTWKICYPPIPDENVHKNNFSGSYDGTPHSATVSVSVLENVTITYSKTENGNYQTDAPSYTNVGTYTVYYKITVENYEPKTGTLTVNITPGATHTIAVAASENGTADAQINGASVASAGHGTEITLVATPDSGYRLKKWTVTTAGEAEIAVTNDKFTMPNEDVAVKAEFEQIPSGGSGNTGISGGSDTPATPAAPTENYTIPVKNENTVKVEAEIKEGKAEVSEITGDTIEKVVNNPNKESKVDTITIDLSGAKQEVTGVTLSKKSVETLAKATAEKDNGIETATIELSKATIVLDNKTLETLVDQAKGSQIELVVADTHQKNLNAAQQTTLGQYQVATTFEAYFTSDGTRIHDFKGGKAVVSIDFTPEEGKDVRYYHLVYVSDDGNLSRYKTKYVNGRLMFTTTHFSDYAVVYDESEENETQEITVDTTFRKLRLAEAKATKNAVKVSWKQVDDADGYILYGALCNSKGKVYKLKAIAAIKSGSKTTYTNKKLKSGTFYKYRIKAYKLVNGKKVWLAQSKVIHVTTTGGKYGNATAVKVNKTSVPLTEGKTFAIKAEPVAENKPIKRHANIKFESTNSKVATVNSKGRIRAKKKGICYIYVYAQNGVYKKIKVTVK